MKLKNIIEEIRNLNFELFNLYKSEFSSLDLDLDLDLGLDFQDFRKIIFTENSFKIKIDAFEKLLDKIELLLIKKFKQYQKNNHSINLNLTDNEMITLMNIIKANRPLKGNLQKTISKIFSSICKLVNPNENLSEINSIMERISIKESLVELLENKKLLQSSTNNVINSEIINSEIVELSNKLKELESKNKSNENLLESERLEKDKLIKELEFKNKQFNEQLEKENELNKINRAIEKLNVPCTELKEMQIKLKENRDNFDKYAMDMFKIAIWIFTLMTLYLFLFTEINDITKSVSIGYYLTHSFPILFPTIIGFLFIRQSNINAKELDKVNRRFILIHEVNQSLSALVEINDEKQMNEKTQKVIDKLIENILNYASENSNSNINDNQELNFLRLNKGVDNLIDTIDKKISLLKGS